MHPYRSQVNTGSFISFFLFITLGEEGGRGGERKRGREKRREGENMNLQTSTMYVWCMHTCMFRDTLVWRPEKTSRSIFFHLLLKTGAKL